MEMKKDVHLSAQDLLEMVHQEALEIHQNHQPPPLPDGAEEQLQEILNEALNSRKLSENELDRYWDMLPKRYKLEADRFSLRRGK